MSQVLSKWIGANQIDGGHIRLSNNTTLRGRNAANSADVDLFKVNTSNKFEFQTLPEANSSLATPSSNKQFATVEYVASVAAGKTDAKDSVYALADSNLALTGSTPLSVDGLTLADGDTVGLVGQTDGTQNGPYLVTIVSSTWTLTRRSTESTSADFTNGQWFKVVAGTVYAGYECLLTTTGTITLGSTSLTYVKYPSQLSEIAGDMLTKSGVTWSIDLHSTSGLESSNAGNVAGQLRIKLDTSSAEKDQTLKINGSNQLVGKKAYKESFTLSSTDITNQYIDLANVAETGSIIFGVEGAPPQFETTDYTVNYTGGASSKTRITFANGLATGGASALVATDVVRVQYTAY